MIFKRGADVRRITVDELDQEEGVLIMADLFEEHLPTLANKKLL